MYGYYVLLPRRCSSNSHSAELQLSCRTGLFRDPLQEHRTAYIIVQISSTIHNPMALSAACTRPLTLPSTLITARPCSTCRRSERLRRHITASMVSKDNMPEQYKDGSKYKLQFVCFTRLAPEQTTANFQEGLPEHLSWLQGLDKSGQLAFHGNFLNPEASNYGSGMYALLCSSTAEAKQLAEQDPLHAAGVRRFEMLPWVQQLKW